MKKKLHIENISGGAKIFDKRSFGALKNLVPISDGLMKRNGHKTVTFLRDSDGAPLKINGIFAYSYKKDGEEIQCKIVHAGNHFFKLDKDFKNARELEYENGITVKNERSRAFCKDEVLYILGAGDILICDGEKIKSAYFTSGTYIPTTARMITDRKMGMKSEKHESPNLLNPRRINKLYGGGTHKNLNEENVFVLDGEIEYGKRLVIDIKIRTKVSSDSDNEYTTSYVGINELGEEVSTVVNLHYERDNIDDSVIFFLTEPIRNDRGEKIKIKIGDKIHDYNTVPFGVRIKNHREICFGFDLDAPYPNEENVIVEYQTSDTLRALLYDVELCAMGTDGDGGELLMFTRGGNELYYSGSQNVFSYLPSENKISFGGADKITSVVQLWDNLVGVFKNNGFYRVRFEGDGYELISSADTLGASSPYATSVCLGDCLALSERGAFGVDDYKSSVRDTCLLSPRSEDIDTLLLGYTANEKREAVSCVENGRYYLFIGNECYVGVPTAKSSKEYDWFPWYGFGARVVTILDGEIYFGKENGEIRKMYNGFFDITEREYSLQTLSLIIDNEGEKTRLITDREGIFGEVTVEIGTHLIYLGRAKNTSGGIVFVDSSPYYPDGSAKIFYGDTLVLEKDGESTEYTVDEVSTNTVLLEGIDVPAEPVFYKEEEPDCQIYLKRDNGVYEAEWENGGVYLKIAGERVKVKGFSEAKMVESAPFLCEYKTAPLPIGTHAKNATVTGAYLNAYSGTEGEINLEISTRLAKYVKKITTAPPLDFDAFDFDRLDTAWGLDSQIRVPFFVRGFDYLDVTLLSSDKKPVYAKFIMLEYYSS